MKYFKVIHKDTGGVVCYVETKDTADEVCAILGSEYGDEEISKEEYEQQKMLMKKVIKW